MSAVYLIIVVGFILCLLVGMGGGDGIGDAILGYVGLITFTGGVFILAVVQIINWISN